MVIRYPHLLKFISINGAVAGGFPYAFPFSFGGSEPTQNSFGHWVIPEADSEEMQVGCRAWPVAAGTTHKSEDGQEVKYTWDIYLPKDCPTIPEGLEVSIFQGDELIGKGTVKRFFPYPFLGNRIWL
ncbi:hypothetical protein [Adhaeribacter aquaticus]|uniref:hypothetical protein n=1 Tax=Adhaeribacter aquaticus TaxID=299567 RepID=UPI0004021760|nr:hypothetical protein [Adhaeribacter aquaticus]